MAEISHHHPLTAIMWGCIEKLDLVNTCHIDRDKLLKFIKVIETGYRDNPYHSRIHAADVVHGVYWFCQTGGLGARIGISPHEMYVYSMSNIKHARAHPEHAKGGRGKHAINIR